MKRIFVAAMSALSVLTFSFPAEAYDASLPQVGACESAKPKKELKEVTFSVKMHCESCVKKISENIAFEKGVKDLEVSLEKQTVWIKYDASRTSEEALKSAIEKLGYKAEKI